MYFKTTCYKPWDIKGKFENKRLVVITATQDSKRVAILHSILELNDVLKWRDVISNLVAGNTGNGSMYINVDHRWTMSELKLVQTTAKKFDHSHKTIKNFINSVSNDMLDSMQTTLDI